MGNKSHFVSTGIAAHSKRRRRLAHFAAFYSVVASFDPFSGVAAALNCAKYTSTSNSKGLEVKTRLCQKKTKSFQSWQVFLLPSSPHPACVLSSFWCMNRLISVLLHEKGFTSRPPRSSPLLLSAPAFFISPLCLSPRLLSPPRLFTAT